MCVGGGEISALDEIVKGIRSVRLPFFCLAQLS